MNFKYVELINLHKCRLWGKVERPVEKLWRFPKFVVPLCSMHGR